MLRLIAVIIIASSSLYTIPAMAEQKVEASWYGHKYHGKRTASGEKFDVRAMTAAHPSLPLGSVVEVRHGRKVVMVRINDRCGRCGIDLSPAAADRLGMRHLGRAPVTLRPLA
ncbi:MAG: hypothetical protein FD176_3415 [Rhodospirillaceae bacterium]|nr:MAG: hypothetical protein FD176_3415 [Rhodospirillaceae bacterium]TNC97522.1 MAG: rlpAH [Stygiobacter sp.]